MARPTGRPPKPIERKRATGNPGKRKLPEPVALGAPGDSTEDVPPPAGLRKAGKTLWAMLMSPQVHWLSLPADYAACEEVCMLLDDVRIARRQARRGDVRWSDLSAMSRQYDGMLANLGLTPSDRARMGVAVAQAADSPAGGLRGALERQRRSASS